MNRWFKPKHRCNERTIAQRAYLGGPGLAFSTGLTDGRVEVIGALDVLLFRDDVLVQHWFKRCPIGVSIGVRTQACTLCQGSNGYYLDTERPVEPMQSNSNPSVLPMVTIFSAVDFQRICDPLHSI